MLLIHNVSVLAALCSIATVAAALPAPRLARRSDSWTAVQFFADAKGSGIGTALGSNRIAPAGESRCSQLSPGTAGKVSSYVTDPFNEAQALYECKLYDGDDCGGNHIQTLKGPSGLNWQNTFNLPAKNNDRIRSAACWWSFPKDNPWGDKILTDPNI